MDGMKNFIRPLVLALLTALVAPAAGLAGETTNYGAGLADATPVAIEDLLSRPEDFVGTKVRVQGKITDVCPIRGCWIDIATRKAQGPIRFKVTDGEIVFPVAAKGRRVTAEGVFARIELDAAGALAYRKHMAEERGETYEPDEESGPLTLYRIDGTGAVVR